MRIFFTIAMLIGISVGSAFAQNVVQEKAQEAPKSYLYQWIDKKGVAHVTDNLSKVPKEYRSKAAILEQTPREDDPEQPRRTTPSRSTQDQQSIDEYAKAEWQQRIRDARQRLRDAQQRVSDLTRKRDEALSAWGGVASGRLDSQQEAARIDEQIRQTQQEIANIQNEIQNVIPDEARRAGVPPGWLRE